MRRRRGRGFSSARTRARPACAGPHSGSALIASCSDRRASGLLYFSRNSSPHAASMPGRPRRRLRLDRACAWRDCAAGQAPGRRAPARDRSPPIGRAPWVRSRVAYLRASKLLVQQAELERGPRSGSRVAAGSSMAAASVRCPRTIASWPRTAAAAGSPAGRCFASASASAGRPRRARRRVTGEALHVRRAALPRTPAEKSPRHTRRRKAVMGRRSPREATRAGHSRPGSASGLVAIIERGSPPLGR